MNPMKITEINSVRTYETKLTPEIQINTLRPQNVVKTRQNKNVLLRERKRHTACRIAALSPDLPTGWGGVPPTSFEGLPHPVPGGVPHPVSRGGANPTLS